MINQNKVDKLKAFENQKVTPARRNFIFMAMFGLIIVFAVMFASAILSGMLAIITTVVVGCLLFYGTRLLKAADPLVRQKTKNILLKKMYEEAAKHAIEQLSNEVIHRQDVLAEKRKARDKMQALIRKLKGSLKETNIGKPIHQKKLETIKTIENAYTLDSANIDKIAEANKEFEQKVDEYREYNSFSELANEAMSYSTGDSKLSDMLSTHAFDSIDTKFNTAIAAIENTARDAAIDSAD